MSSIEHGYSEDRESNHMDALSKFLRPSALYDDAKSTFRKYLGKGSTEVDHLAFVEYIETEYVTNEYQKLETSIAVKIGIYSLLDGMDVNQKSKLPPLDMLLDADAYRRGNSATFAYYLGERHSRESEVEFRQRLHYLQKLFGYPMDKLRATYVAKYMVGVASDDDVSSDSDDSDSQSDASSSETDDASSESDVSSESDDDDHDDHGDHDRHHHHHHHSSHQTKYEDDSSSSKKKLPIAPANIKQKSEIKSSEKSAHVPKLSETADVRHTQKRRS